MLRLYISIIFLIIFKFSFTQQVQNVKIKLFSDVKVKSFVIRFVEGKHEIILDKDKILKSKKHTIIYFTIVGDSLSAWDLDKHIGIYKQIDIISKNRNNELRVECAYPALKERKYEGNLTLYSKDSSINIINTINLEKYVAGVVESESGPNAVREYYKTQAIICRTYALDHLNRHILEGYNLCDNVHCQVFKSKPYQNHIIIEATKSTEGLVITDTSFNLITAAFHSNSGGQTINSEDVWSSATSYLKSITDTFAYNQIHSEWLDSIALLDWIDYLEKNNITINPSNITETQFEFNQSLRKIYFYCNGDSIPLKKIRSDFKFKSTFFSTELKDGFIYFSGKGYGHGVGLSQESAMQMAKIGYSYYEIINCFYKNIRIINVEYTPVINPLEINKN